MKIDVACYSIRILCVVFVYMVAPYREYVALRDSCHLYYMGSAGCWYEDMYEYFL